ncbi:hypothetical protein [Bacillus subtilis]|uniref:hypothetical protein n=1 Tax=Bacillus subtilis TaxID=1423 RepID=UPI00202A1494|nr:hypothetical protein [Bacillus subtilis]
MGMSRKAGRTQAMQTHENHGDLLQQQNSNQQAEINLLSQTVRLLTQLVAKDPNVILSVQELNKIQDEAYNKERNQKGLLNNVSFS